MSDTSIQEKLDIVRAYDAASANGRRCALASVVGVVGSSFRRPGARMLVDDAGDIVAGCISGGCLESDAAEWCARAISERAPRLLTYVSRAETAADRLLGLGSGCDGVIDVLVQALDTGADPEIALLRTSMASGNGWAKATVITRGHPALGCWTAVDDSGARLTSGDPAWCDELAELAMRCRSDDRYGRVHAPIAGEAAGLLCERLERRPRVLICGAGPDAESLAAVALLQGWQVVVADHRRAYTTPGRFARCVELHTMRPDGLIDAVQPDRLTACVVKTHDYGLDCELLRALSCSDSFYVGLLGSRQRAAHMLADLAQGGCDVSKLLGARFHSPIGIAIGASDPAAIALSIAAEIRMELAARG